MVHNLRNDILQKLWNTYAQDVGKSLIHLGAFGWFLSSAAQLGMIVKNKNIDKKEKQFLIPQEMSDGIINVTLYYTICQGIKKGCEQLLERGAIFTDKSMRTILHHKPGSNSAADYIKSMSEIFRIRGLVGTKKIKSVGNLTDFYNGSIAFLSKSAAEQARIMNDYPALKLTFKPIIESGQVKQSKRYLNRALKDYTLFKNGVGVVAAVGASVLACSVITPVLRNYTANVYQKRALNRQTKDKINQPMTTYPLPMSNTFNMFKI